MGGRNAQVGNDMGLESKKPFVVLEGSSGVGKTTVIKGLKPVLTDWEFLREPGGTDFGNLMMEAVQQRMDIEIDPMAALFAYSASRANLVRTKILPVINGEVDRTGVLLDRYWYSTLAYQGSEGVGEEVVLRVSSIATGGLEPNLVLLFDLAPELALMRKKGCSDIDRYDLKGLEFLSRTRDAYLELAYRYRDYWRVIDASQNKENVLSDTLVAMHEFGLV